MIPTRCSRPGFSLRAGCAAGAVALVAAVAAMPQSVLLRLDPEEGLVSRYEMTMQSHMDAPMMPSSEEPFMLMETTSTQTVTGVEGDVRLYEVVVDSSRVETPAMPALAQSIPDMTGMKHTMRMDVRGRVVGMDMDETGPAPAREMMAQMASRGFGMDLPEGPVAPGDTWKGTQEFDMSGMPGQSMTMKIDMTYELQALDGEVAVVSIAGPLSMSGTGSGMQASGQMAGTMRLDVAAGRIVESEMETSMDMSVQGQSMSVSQTMTMTLVGA